MTPTVVLTAAHCVAELSQDGMRIETGIARHVSVYQGDNETARSDLSDSVFHSQWNETNLQSGVDLGILYLARALPIDPIQLDRTAASDRVGQIGKIVGFGRDESGNGGRKKSTTMRVAESF